MNRESIKSFVTYYLQSLSERTRREKSGTKWGIDWVIYNIGLAKYGKPVRLPFLRQGDAGFPKSKVEAEFGVDLAFLADEGLRLVIFVLKDEPLTNSTWTRNDFDRDLRMAMDPDLDSEGLQHVESVEVILAYNKDDQQNGIEAFERLVNNAPPKLRGTVKLGFTRWNLSELVEQTIAEVLSPSLLPERFFGQLTYLSAQVADFRHGSDAWQQQLIPSWRQFLHDVLTESGGTRGVLLIPIALIILRQQAHNNPSIQTGWIDLIEWAAVALWKLYNEGPKDLAVPVFRFWRDFYLSELERFYRAHIQALTTEHAIDEATMGSFLGAITASYVAYWHLARIGILSISLDEVRESEADRDNMLNELADWCTNLVNASPATMRPVLDIQHIEIFLLVEVFRRAGRLDAIATFFVVLTQRLHLRRVSAGNLPFIDGNNSIVNVLEEIAAKPTHSLLLTSSSYLVLMLLELCFLLPQEGRDTIVRTMYRRLVLGDFDAGPRSDRPALNLMSWFPPADWPKRVFDSGPELGQGVAVEPFAPDRNSPAQEIVEGVKRLVSLMRAESPILQLPKDIPEGAMILASLKQSKPVPPELWRRWAFPLQEQSNTGSSLQQDETLMT